MQNGCRRDREFRDQPAGAQVTEVDDPLGQVVAVRQHRADHIVIGDVPVDGLQPERGHHRREPCRGAVGDGRQLHPGFFRRHPVHEQVDHGFCVAQVPLQRAVEPVGGEVAQVQRHGARKPAQGPDHRRGQIALRLERGPFEEGQQPNREGGIRCLPALAATAVQPPNRLRHLHPAPGQELHHQILRRQLRGGEGGVVDLEHVALRSLSHEVFDARSGADQEVAILLTAEFADRALDPEEQRRHGLGIRRRDLRAHEPLAAEEVKTRHVDAPRSKTVNHASLAPRHC